MENRAPGSTVASAAVAVVIPAFRASRTISATLTRCRAQVPEATLLVVDDGSDDDTAGRALAAGAAVASHEVNEGKGRALATGIAAALALDGVRWLVTLDADGQHPPEAISALLAVLASGTADLVVGARARDPALMPLARRCSNWLSSTLVSRATGHHVPDSQSGFRAMTRAVAERVRPQGRRYEFETEFLLDAAGLGFRLGWIAIPTVYAGEASHFRYISDTLALSRVFLRHWRSIVKGPRPTA
jgi:glycosyltransferase involved in cell wall biosynthesis